MATHVSHPAKKAGSSLATTVTSSTSTGRTGLPLKTSVWTRVGIWLQSRPKQSTPSLGTKSAQVMEGHCKSQEGFLGHMEVQSIWVFIWKICNDSKTTSWICALKYTIDFRKSRTQFIWEDNGRYNKFRNNYKHTCSCNKRGAYFHSLKNNVFWRMIWIKRTSFEKQLAPNSTNISFILKIPHTSPSTKMK